MVITYSRISILDANLGIFVIVVMVSGILGIVWLMFLKGEFLRVKGIGYIIMIDFFREVFF